MTVLISQTKNLDFNAVFLENVELINNTLSLKKVSSYFTPSTANVIPVMTSNTSPSGIASVSAGGYGTPISNAYTIFNGNVNGMQIAAAPSWAMYEFPTSKVISEYALTISLNYRIASAWRFEGSNDGTNWVTLDTQSGYSWSNNQRRVFSFKNSTSYTKYRFYVTNSNGDAVSIGELEMFENIEKPYYSASGSVEFITTSLGDYLKSIDKIVNSTTIPTGTNIKTYTSTSNNKVDFTNYIETNSDGTVNSPKGQFIKVKVVFNGDSQDTSFVQNDFLESEKSMFEQNDKVNFNGKLTIKPELLPTQTIVVSNNSLNVSDKIKNIKITATSSRNISTTTAVPIMTSNTTPSGIASASGSSSGTVPYQAFDSSSTSRWEISGTPSWLRYQFPSVKQIGSYAITCYFSGWTPSAWRLEGSNDGTNWTTLDTRSGQGFTSSYQKKSYAIPDENIGSYLNYRLYFTAAAGNTPAVATLELFEVTDAPILRILASPDNGVKWNSFKDGSWINIGSLTEEHAKNYGMDMNSFNAITSEQWSEFNPFGNIRLAYFLKQDSSLQTLFIDNVNTTELLSKNTPSLASSIINYTEIDKNYYGLMFMDENKQYYSTSFGDIIKYLDFGSIIAGQTSLEAKVILSNSFNFSVNNVELMISESIDNLEVELSKTINPFIASKSLLYTQQLNPGEELEFYVRVVVNKNATTGGSFDIEAKAKTIR